MKGGLKGGTEGRTDGGRDGRTEGRTEGRMDGRRDGGMEGRRDGADSGFELSPVPMILRGTHQFLLPRVPRSTVHGITVWGGIVPVWGRNEGRDEKNPGLATSQAVAGGQGLPKYYPSTNLVLT